MNQKLFLMIFSILFAITACQDIPQSKEETASNKVENKTAKQESEAVTKTEIASTESNPALVDKRETVKKNTGDAKVSSIESDIQVIRDKYAIITKGTGYKSIQSEYQCDEMYSVNFERKYNEKGELSYLLFHDCSDHGCTIRHHYYWDGELIFIFSENDYMPGASHIIEEHRTYFKNGQMIRCLEKEANYHPGQPPMAELLKKAVNKEVDCTPEKRTKNLSEMENLKMENAQKYFCPS